MSEALARALVAAIAPQIAARVRAIAELKGQGDD
jgi:hypothetical protein